MKSAWILALAGLVLAACTSFSESGWIRITGAMVESDGREIKNCWLDVYDAATDERLVGNDVNGVFDEQLYPSHPAKSYYFLAKCRAFKEEIKLGPYDTETDEWTQPMKLGDIVFRRIPG